MFSQMPVHCSTGQLLKEPDVLPKLTCLFEKEIVHETTEVSVFFYNSVTALIIETFFTGQLLLNSDFPGKSPIGLRKG